MTHLVDIPPTQVGTDRTDSPPSHRLRAEASDSSAELSPATTSATPSINVPRALAHLAVLGLGLALLYGWMATLPFYGDSLYFTNSRMGLALSDIFAAFDPRHNLQNETTSVLDLYRPTFIGLVVPLLQRLNSPVATQLVNLTLVFLTGSVLYLLSYRLSRCQDSALLVAGFFAFHAALFDGLLMAGAGVNAMFTYLLIALALLISRRFAVHPSFSTLFLTLSVAFLAVFSWERVILLPLGLAFLVLGWRLFDPHVNGEDAQVPLARRLPVEFSDPGFLLVLLGGIAIMALYWLARIARYGNLMESHHELSATVSGAMAQLVALLLGIGTYVPSFVPHWWGVHFEDLSRSARLCVLAYCLLITYWLLRSLIKRPSLASLGLVFGGLLVLPNFSSNQLLSIRYADFLVLGLTVTLSAVPLFRRPSSPHRSAWVVGLVLLMIATAATYELAQFGVPRHWPYHYLTSAARLADSIQNTARAQHLQPSERRVLLLSRFFNYNEMWIFNATPLRLGSFFFANFGVPRDHVTRFSPDLVEREPSILVDLHYRLGRNANEATAMIVEATGADFSQAVEWHAHEAFDCATGSVLRVDTRRPMLTKNDHELVRIAFSGTDQYFTMIEPFATHQQVATVDDHEESRVFALVPPGTSRCLITPFYASDTSISSVSLLPLRH